MGHLLWDLNQLLVIRTYWNFHPTFTYEVVQSNLSVVYMITMKIGSDKDGYLDSMIILLQVNHLTLLTTDHDTITECSHQGRAAVRIDVGNIISR